MAYLKEGSSSVVKKAPTKSAVVRKKYSKGAKRSEATKSRVRRTRRRVAVTQTRARVARKARSKAVSAKGKIGKWGVGKGGKIPIKGLANRARSGGSKLSVSMPRRKYTGRGGKTGR